MLHNGTFIALQMKVFGQTIKYILTITNLFYLSKPIAYLISQVNRKCLGSNKNACNLSVCQVVRAKISISKFFDTTHNGIVL